MLNPAQAGIENAAMALSTEAASVELASGISLGVHEKIGA